MISLVRLVQIGLAVYGHLFWWGLVRIGVWRSAISPAQHFSRTLEKLGTPFIKLGQGLSMHTEFLPDDYVAALASLQDHVAPFPGSQSVLEIETSIGRPIGELFAQFEIEPMAAGSIAQVHLAQMDDGQDVIVKVRRPGIKRRVEQDMRILALLVRVAVLLVPRLRRLDPIGLVQEVLRNLRGEMDFRQEARNIRQFARMFKDSSTVFIPNPIEGMQTEWISVQVMSGGYRIDDPRVSGHGPAMAQAFVDAYLHQFFSAGVFHGDPHPGNLFAMADGRLCFHDFGLIGYLDKRTRQNLAAFMQAFVLQDPQWLLDAAVDLGILAGNLDQAAFESGLEELTRDYAQLPLREWSFAKALLRISRMGGGQNVRIPHNLLVLIRAVFLIESAVRALDPSFNLMDGLLAKAPAFMGQESGSTGTGAQRLQYELAMALKQLPESLGSLIHEVRHGRLEIRFAHTGLDAMERQIDRASNKITLSLVTLGLYIAASLLMQHSIGPMLYGFPVLAAFGYALAAWLTLRLVRSTRRLDES